MCSPPKIRGAFCKGLARGPQQLLSDGSTHAGVGEAAAVVVVGGVVNVTASSALDAQVQPWVRKTAAASARSRLHEKETSGRSGEREKNIDGTR